MTSGGVSLQRFTRQSFYFHNIQGNCFRLDSDFCSDQSENQSNGRVSTCLTKSIQFEATSVTVIPVRWQEMSEP